MKTKVIIFLAIVITSTGVFAQPSPRPFNQNIDKEFIKEFLKTNPSYRLMEETKDGLIFISPLPNKYYPSGGYTPDKPTDFHSYDINKKNKTIDEMMIEPDCEDKTFVMSVPDSKGVFRYVVWNEKMPAVFNEAFCNRSWSAQVREARREVREVFGLSNSQASQGLFGQTSYVKSASAADKKIGCLWARDRVVTNITGPCDNFLFSKNTIAIGDSFVANEKTFTVNVIKATKHTKQSAKLLGADENLFSCIAADSEKQFPDGNSRNHSGIWLYIKNCQPN
jgi:hypothetical protein